MPAMPQRPSLVVQTSTVLRGHLQAGMWQSRLPAERALCEQLQVSRQTLRAALAALQREGLIKLVGRMRHNMTGGQARSIKSAGRRQVTLLMPEPPEVLSPTTLLALSNLREKLGAAGYEVDLRVEPLCFGSRPNRALEKLAQTRPATVWVVWGSREPMQRWLVQRQLPALIIGSCGPGISLPSVDKDYRATCRHAGDLLWRKGHHRLALVLPRDAYDGDRDSERGFMEALDQHPEAELQVLRHDGSVAHLGALLDQVLRQKAPPTGYLVVRAAHALTVAMHLLRRRLRLPQDAAVLSRDDEIYLQHTSPALSRYAVNPGQFASKILKAVREMAETGTLAPRAVRFIPALIAGETV